MNTPKLLAAIALTCTLFASACSDDPASTNNNTPSTVNVVTGVELGGPGSAGIGKGNLYDVESDSGWAIHLYSSKRHQIDFIYNHIAKNDDSTSICSPDYDPLSETDNYFGYITKTLQADANNTEFRKLPSFTTAQFDALKDSAVVTSTFNAAGVSSDVANHLKVGDVVAFRTEAGTIGLFKVTSFFGSTSPLAITISIMTKK